MPVQRELTKFAGKRPKRQLHEQSPIDNVLATKRKRTRAPVVNFETAVKVIESSDESVDSVKRVEQKSILKNSQSEINLQEAPPTRLKKSSSKLSMASDISDNERKLLNHSSNAPDFGKFTVKVLKELCASFGLPADGTKEELVSRLQANLSVKDKDGSSTQSSLLEEEDMEMVGEGQDDVLAAGHTIIPKVADDGYEIAELHEFDLHSRSWKSPCVLIRVKVEKKAFQKGAMRKAYKAKVLEQPDKTFVVKDYIDDATTDNYYFKDVQMQVASGFYCQSLNRYIEKLRSSEEVPSATQRVLEKCHPLTFNETFLLKMQNSGKLYVGENFIQGKYTKFNNNFGYVAERSDFMNDYAQAFSHYTHERSNGDILIIDIQGSHEVFTDPQIHTNDPKNGFGLGNLSQEGMVKFMETHKCQSVCKALGLKPLVPPKIVKKTGGKKKGAKRH